jgi:hypothetical protein
MRSAVKEALIITTLILWSAVVLSVLLELF